MNPDAKFILAHDLDEAGVENWQVRLRDARERDADEFRHGVSRLVTHYDREWQLIKREYNAAMARGEVV